MRKFSGLIVLPVLLFVLVLASCDSLSQKAGTFSVSFSWAKDDKGTEVKPDVSSGDFHVTVRIYEWKDGVAFPGDIAANGKQLTQSDPAKMKVTGTSINFSDLSYGNRRFVVAEIRKGAELTGGILFSGMSTLFDFKAGKHTEVNVEMSMTPTPGVDEEGNRIDAELRIVDDNGNLKSYTSGNDLKVKLKLLNAVSFTKVYVANKEEDLKTKSGKLYDIKELKKITDAENGYEINEDWDLSFGLTADEISISPELKVYARLENEYGTGLLVMAKIALDNQSPELTLGLNPAYANGIKTITLNISANELIRHDSLTVTANNEKLKFDCPTPTKNESLSFTCTVETLDAAIKDGDYEIKVTANDQAGNSAEQKTTLAIDREAPDLTFTAYKNENEVDDTIYLKENDEFKIELTLSKEPSELPVVRLGSAQINCEKMANLKYTCTAEIKKATYSEGISDLSVNYQDLAENQFNGTIISGIRLDYTAPAISGLPTILITKPSGCPLSTATAVTKGSSVVVSFVVNEELAGDPIVSAVRDADIIPMIFGSQIGYFYTFTVENIDPGSIQDGSYSIKIELADTVGNVNTVTSSGFALRTAKPATPKVDDENKITYRRIPWGSSETGGVKYYSIKAEGEVVDENTAWIYAYDSLDLATASEIGKTQATGKNFSEFELNRADRVDVYVAAYDNACNRSDVVKVRDVEWTATMGYKVPGSTFENPHTFMTNGSFNKTLNQDPVFLQEPLSGGKVRKEADGQFNWKQIKEGVLVPQLTGVAMAYDSTRGKVVRFGGQEKGGAVFFNETWEWDGTHWTKKNPRVSPQPRSMHAMVYDSSRGKVLLFGGGFMDDPSLWVAYDDTWEWDGETWSQLTPKTSPAGRMAHGMAYDAVRDKTVLFGGATAFVEGNPISDNETWEWDGENWTQIDSLNKPSERNIHAMTYDSVHEKVVLFGGSSGAAETWEWDGENWTLIAPATVPMDMEGAVMAYDNVRNKAVLFGGNDSETWEWDGTNWTKLNPANKSNATQGHAMAYDSARGRMVLFGGRYIDEEFNYFTETWEWDGTNWSKKNQPNMPVTPFGHAMAYDSARGRLVLFGGSVGPAITDETWEWDGSSWERFDPPTKPEGRIHHAMVYDPVRGNVVLFGGGKTESNNCDGSGSDLCNGTWIWNGKDWKQKMIATKPSARYFHTMAYDNELESVILFGGTTSSGDNNETWRWDGTKWTKMNPANKPTARIFSSMNYDSERNGLILFGGGETVGGENMVVPLNDTWEWNGSNWTQLFPSTVPSVRYGHAMTFDSDRKKLLLFGGAIPHNNSKLTNNETWEWNGSNWRLLLPITMPATRAIHSMAYHTATGSAMIFGGLGYINQEERPYRDTWQWNGGSADYPAQLMKTVFSAAAAGKSLDAIQSVTAMLIAGGTGYAGTNCTEVNGAKMMLWSTVYHSGAWVEIATNTASKADVDTLEFTTSDPDFIKQIFFGDERSINIAVIPVSANGCNNEMGTIATDYAEVVVRYRLSD